MQTAPCSPLDILDFPSSPISVMGPGKRKWNSMALLYRFTIVSIFSFSFSSQLLNESVPMRFYRKELIFIRCSLCLWMLVTLCLMVNMVNRGVTEIRNFHLNVVQEGDYKKKLQENFLDNKIHATAPDVYHAFTLMRTVRVNPTVISNGWRSAWSIWWI